MQDSESEHVYEGRVAIGRRLDGILAIAGHPMAGSSKKAPNYEIRYKHAGRTTWSIVGSGWLKTSEDGDTEFVSMSLDNPDWPDGLNLSGFKREAEKDEPGMMDIIWSRPRSRRVQDEAQ